MTHQLNLTEEQFKQVDGLLMTKRNPLHATNDTLIISLEGHREQKVKYIKQIVTENVNAHYCYLLLSETRGVDDVPEMGQAETK